MLINRKIDHLVILAHEMDAAVTAYQKMGFTITRRMFHPFGTANNLIMFQSSFLEILGIVDPDRLEGLGMQVRQSLSEKEGVSHYAMFSNDINADHQEFTDKYLRPMDVSKFEREVILPDGQELKAVVSVCVPYQPDTPRAQIFVCQQHVPEAVWVPEWQHHENGAEDIVSVTIVSEDPVRDFGVLFAALFGEDNLEIDKDGLTATPPDGRIQVLTPSAFKERFADDAVRLETVFPYVAAMTIKVKSLTTLHAVLNTNGMKYMLTAAGTTFIDAADANGVLVEFSE